MTNSTTYVPLVAAKEKPRDPYTPPATPPALACLFYFTFGQSHKTMFGVEMRDRYVGVEATSRVQAIEAFKGIFMRNYMQNPNHWAMCYNDYKISKDEVRKYWPRGEYLRIHIDGHISVVNNSATI